MVETPNKSIVHFDPWMWLYYVASKHQDPIIQWRNVTFQKNTILKKKHSSTHVQWPVLAEVKSKRQREFEVKSHYSNARGTHIVTVSTYKKLCNNCSW